MSILVQEPTGNWDQMIIYPQKPTILAQKRSFTPNFFEFQHFFVHRPLKTSNACIEKSIYPLKRLIRGIFSLQPLWNHCFARNEGFEVSGLPRFARNDGFRVTGLPCFARNDGLESVDCFTLFVMTGLKSLDCHASLTMTGLKSVDCFTLFAMTGLESVDYDASLAMTGLES